IVNIATGVTNALVSNGTWRAGAHGAAVCSQRHGGGRVARSRQRLRSLVSRRRTPADGDGAGIPRGLSELPVTGRVRLRDQRDRVRQLPDRLQVAERREPGESKGIEVVAEQQGEVRIVGSDVPLRTVVQVRSLEDHLQKQLVLRLAASRPRATRRASFGAAVTTGSV